MPGIFSDVFSGDGSQTGQSSETTANLEGAQDAELSPELGVAYDVSFEDLDGGSHTMAGELTLSTNIDVEAAYQVGGTLVDEDYSGG